MSFSENDHLLLLLKSLWRNLCLFSCLWNQTTLNESREWQKWRQKRQELPGRRAARTQIDIDGKYKTLKGRFIRGTLSNAAHKKDDLAESVSCVSTYSCISATPVNSYYRLKVKSPGIFKQRCGIVSVWHDSHLTAPSNRFSFTRLWQWIHNAALLSVSALYTTFLQTDSTSNAFYLTGS